MKDAVILSKKEAATLMKRALKLAELAGIIAGKNVGSTPPNGAVPRRRRRRRRSAAAAAPVPGVKRGRPRKVVVPPALPEDEPDAE
jgi:hypothetical protein